MRPPPPHPLPAPPSGPPRPLPARPRPVRAAARPLPPRAPPLTDWSPPVTAVTARPPPGSSRGGKAKGRRAPRARGAKGGLRSGGNPGAPRARRGRAGRRPAGRVGREVGGQPQGTTGRAAGAGRARRPPAAAARPGPAEGSGQRRRVIGQPAARTAAPDASARRGQVRAGAGPGRCGRPLASRVQLGEQGADALSSGEKCSLRAARFGLARRSGGAMSRWRWCLGRQLSGHFAGPAARGRRPGGFRKPMKAVLRFPHAGLRACRPLPTAAASPGGGGAALTLTAGLGSSCLVCSDPALPKL